MEQQNIGGITASSLTFEGLEPHFRGKIREWMQALLIEEVTEFLGLRKSERKPVLERKGYRNGYGKERYLTTAMGTIAVRRPRVRGAEERFVSHLLLLFVRRTREVRDLLPALYLHGLSEGDFELALRGLLGEEAAIKAKGKFQSWCRQKGFEEAAALIEVDWDRMVTFYKFPQDHWQHLRTTNPVESPFSALRLRTDAAKRYKRVNNATALIWKMLLVAESRFRSLKAPELLKDVWNGERYKDGVKVNNVADGVAA